MDTPFLNNFNKTIADNMRFVRSFNANPDAFIADARAKSAAAKQQGDPMAELLNPMLLMMVFQMLQKMMPELADQAGAQDVFPSNWNVSPDLMNQRNQTTPAPQAESNTPPATEAPPPPENPALVTLKEILSQEQVTPEVQLTRLQDALKNQFFTSGQMAQALKQQIDTAPDAQLPVLSQLAIRLLELGTVNADTLMNDDYLAQLSASRRAALLDIISDAGLRLENGKPNTRLSGILLQYSNQTKLPNTQAFMRELMQQYYDKLNGDLTSTDEGKTLNSLLLLGNITVNDEHKLVFAA